MTSRFAGLYNANNFAYGIAGTLATGPAPLTVNSGTTGGASSITLNYGQTVTSDGITFNPPNINAPMTIGSGSNSETVTPSAVTNNSPGVYGSCQVTATFANAHGNGDPISSGTFGLQEAINAAAAAGGGIVIVDPTWVARGGTQAILNAATLPATVQIQDQRTGDSAPIRYATVAIANAAVKTLNATPVTLAPAAGAGTFNELLTCVFENNFLTAAFAAGSALGIVYGAAGVAAAPTVAATFLTSPAANQMILVTGVLATNLSSAVLNKALVLQAAGAEFTTGAGSLSCRVSYRVHTGL